MKTIVVMLHHPRFISLSFFLPLLLALHSNRQIYLAENSCIFLTAPNKYGSYGGFCAQSGLWQLRPELLKKQAALDAQAYARFKSKIQNPKSKINFTLPVVVHIIHDGGPENIPDAQVLQGIQNLNDAYANLGYYDQGTGLDTKIQFCLAKRDPDGNASTGITRDQSPLTSMDLGTDDIAVKDLNRWDPLSYINIWLVGEIQGSVAGYAYLPASHGLPEDGIVIEAGWFGSSQGNSTVIAHEMGHYLGLYHTFEGGCANDDCFADGDQVCDTPPDNSTAAVPCNGSMNSCDTDANSGFTTDQDDMFWNFMDYGDWDCYSAFTQGQTDRMVFTIENPRVSLLDSKGCLDPCTSPLTASFSASSTTIAVGGTVNFTNTSSNTTSASWEIDGVAFANSSNASYTFNQVGFFEICLTTGNADPNCAGEFCQTITVTCPVAPEFVTDNFYPQPGELVSYTNLSQNATNYEWQIDGVAQANSTNFSFSFPAEGIYDVCLVASNDLCEAEFCLPVFVSENPPTPDECDTSFLKTFGTPGTLEFGQSIIAAPNGGFFIGGGRGTEAMITLLDASANLVWTRQFNPTFDADDFIWKIKLDSDENLIGIGQTAPVGNNIEVYAFRYDWQNDQMLWLNELDIADPAGEGYYDILEKAPGGNFYILGQTTPVGNAFQSDALLLEVDRNTGLNVFAKTFHLGVPAERFLSASVYNNSLYVTGKVGSGPIAFANWNRPGLTRFELDGDQIWTRLYLREIGIDDTGDLVPVDLVEDNGLVIFGAGDSVAIPAQDSRLFLLRTDDDGNLEWAKIFDVPGTSNESAAQVLNLPDGYLCLGNFNDGADSDVAIFKTDKLGNLQWSKRYGGSDSEVGRDLIWQNGLVYLTGATDGSGVNSDVFLASLNPDGSATAADTCNLLDDLDIIATDWEDAYEGQHNLSESNLFANFFTNFETTATVLLQQQIICANPCPEDSCDFVPDAVLENLIGECMGDSTTVSLTVCNLGSFELPAGTPISFYDGDPATGTPNLLAVSFLPEKIKRDSCANLTFRIPAAPPPIFILVNDGGAAPLPLNLVIGTLDFLTEECDYTNNIGSFDVSFTPPPLDLGPDIVVCENGVAELDAGPGFFRYRWQDGSGEQTYTAFLPGTYSVTVTDICGGTQTDEITITVDPATVADLGNDTLVCLGDSLLLSPGDFDRYEWFPKGYFDCEDCPTQAVVPGPDSLVEIIVVASTDLGCYSVDTIEFGATEPVLTFDTIFFCPGDTVLIFSELVTQPGEYTGVFPRPEGCDSTHQISLKPIANLLLELPDDLTIELGDSVRLNPVTNGFNLTWQWSPPDWLSCEDCQRPWTRPFETIRYTLVITDENGCDASDALLLTVLPNRRIYIPNVFSPNGDGINDLFMIFSGGNVAQVREFLIFDRWGEKVFEDFNFQPNDPAHGWDGVFRGKVMNPAVFVYKAEVEFLDGKMAVFYGDATLLR